MKQRRQKHTWVYIAIGCSIVISGFVLLWAAVDATPRTMAIPKPPKHTVPYIDGAAATEQTQAFFDNYIKSPVRKDIDVVALRKKTVEIFGTKNLVFYKAYYQHGFDPIVCSNVMPLKTIAKLTKTGAVATVDVLAEYPDGTNATITATLLFGDEYSLLIDTVTCPGNLSNLPPKK
jgi:hypothetical protein